MVVYGLIEWDGGMTPWLLVGTSGDAVRLRALECIEDMCGTSSKWTDGIPPYPEERTPDVVASWLHELSENATIPWFTILTEDEIEHVD